MSFQSRISAQAYSQGFGTTPVNAVHIDTRAPASSDVNGYILGQAWVNTSANTAYVLTSFSASAGITTASWQEITNAGGGGAGAFTTLTSSGNTTLATGAGTVNTFGNTSGATALTLSVGTGNFLLSGATASTMTIGTGLTTGTILIGGVAQTGTITLGSSSGVNIVAIGAGEGATTVNIAGGATAAKAVNIATGAVANTVAIGSASAGAITVDTAAGISLDAATASNFTVTGAGIDLTLSSVGGSVAIASNEAVATAINLTASDAAGGITLTSGTGNVNLTATNVIQVKSIAGTAVTDQVTNSDNTNAASHASYQVAVGGAASGDPYIDFLVSGAGHYAMGIDNTASDDFVLAASGSLGTTNVVSWSAAGVMTNTGAISATAGNITATNGNFVLNTAGNKMSITTGANASIGQDTLTGGTVTVNTTAVTASSLIFLSRASVGATGAAATGNLVVGTIVAGTSFVINAVQAANATALQASDVSVINWWIVN